jgi:S-DNA-T family DNA segregation ATPase FtsK/SpoIIIE
MTVSRKASGRPYERLLPRRATEFLHRRFIDLVSLALLASALALFGSCLFYDPADPSFNKAAAGPVSNQLGLPGAYAADVCLHTFGAAGLLLPTVLAAWGWRVLRDRTLPLWWLRLSLLPLVLISAGTALSAVPRPADWPFSSGLGGAAGSLVIHSVVALAGAKVWTVALCAAVVASIIIVYTLGITRSEWRAIGRAMNWLRPVGGRGLGGIVRRERAVPLCARSVPEKTRRERREPRLFDDQTKGDGDEAESLPTMPGFVVARSPASSDGKQARGSSSRRKGATSCHARSRVALEGDFELPSLSLLESPRETQREAATNREVLEKNARLLESVLDDFGVRGEIVKVRPGPVVTRYELEPAPGTKTSRVVGLADDIARSMSAISVRVAVVAGSSAIGIELPNARRELVYLRELLGSQMYERAGSKLPLILGRDISGASVMVDLARMPHILIAGTTGSGKSVAINAMILSLLYRLSPADCKFIMVDPKMLELSVYDGIPHLLSPVVTDPKKAIVALKWTVREMEDRYRSMSLLGVRNIDGYNARVGQAKRTGEVLTRRVQTGFDLDTGQPVHEEEPLDLEPLPYIVVVVDEMADLMLVAGKDIEVAVQRLAQMARAAGIHLIMATQRPSVDVITGTIKANFPTRISFHVTSKIDSRTILGETGAEQLLGQGDMLYMAHGGRITRVHAPLVTDQEVEKVVAFLKTQGQPSYIEAVTDEDDLSFHEFGAGAGNEADELYDRAVALVCHERKASTSFVQRHLQIGYNRAARIIERMEVEGVISVANHVGKREVLVRRPTEE